MNDFYKCNDYNYKKDFLNSTDKENLYFKKIETDKIFCDFDKVNKKDYLSNPQVGNLIRRLSALQLANSVASTGVPSVPTQTQPSPIPAIASLQQNAQLQTSPEDKAKIDSFLQTIFGGQQSERFRGWILPNGKLMSQFNDAIGIRQDHGDLVRVFIEGLSYTDKSLSDKVEAAYKNYLNVYRSQGMSAIDLQESFAVDVLGWMQISYTGSRKIIAQAANWQNQYLLPFVLDYNFSIVERPSMGYIEELRREKYDNVTEIIKAGLEAREVRRAM